MNFTTNEISEQSEYFYCNLHLFTTSFQWLVNNLHLSTTSFQWLVNNLHLSTTSFHWLVNNLHLSTTSFQWLVNKKIRIVKILCVGRADIFLTRNTHKQLYNSWLCIFLFPSTITLYKPIYFILQCYLPDIRIFVRDLAEFCAKMLDRTNNFSETPVKIGCLYNLTPLIHEPPLERKLGKYHKCQLALFRDFSADLWLQKWDKSSGGWSERSPSIVNQPQFDLQKYFMHGPLDNQDRENGYIYNNIKQTHVNASVVAPILHRIDSKIFKMV